MLLKQKVLIVEDEESIVSFLTTVLIANGFEVITAGDGLSAYSMITSHCPDIVILDLGLPDFDGMKIITTVREWSSIPIIVVSARTHERDKVAALDAGADDYITKPFGTSELLARVRTALRHSGNTDQTGAVYENGLFKSGDFVIDYNKQHVYVGGKDAHLTQNEYKIVALLGRHAGKVLTYDFIMKKLWGPAAGDDNQILRVNMANIRRKIGETPADPKYIFTELGMGYRMIEATE